VNGEEKGQAEDFNKKAAEQAASALALKKIEVVKQGT